MKTIEIKILTFEELTPEAQQVAINWLRNLKQEDSNLLCMFNEYAHEQLKEKGFINPQISYSLSYSQGDGLSFKADKYEHLEQLFIEVLGPGKEKTAQILAENCTQKFTGNTGHYCYAHRNQIDLYLENYTSSINVTNTNNIDAVIQKVLTKLENLYLEICGELEKQGYNEIDYQLSDECLKEENIANDYEFTEDGKRY